MSVHASPNIVEDGLVLCLDAGNERSYGGTGTTWKDLSGNGYDFTIVDTAFTNSNNIKFMNFEGSHGAAKRIVNNTLTNVPSFENATLIVFSTILNSTSTWRTLVRGSVADHQVIISTSNLLGMYDNNATGFLSSGLNITSLPNPYTQFNFMCWRISQESPYYEFQFNEDTNIYSITNSAATFNNGFSVIGSYHNNSTNPATNSQYWGKISVFLYYNKHLSQSEIKQNFNALRGRFGL